MVGPDILCSIYQCCFLAVFLARSGSIKRVLTQLTLPQRSCVGQPEGPEVAPPSVFNGRNCIEVCAVGSGISSAASCYCKGHYCDQFFTKFDDTEYVYQRMIGTRAKPGSQLVQCIPGWKYN